MSYIIHKIDNESYRIVDKVGLYLQQLENDNQRLKEELAVAKRNYEFWRNEAYHAVDESEALKEADER